MSYLDHMNYYLSNAHTIEEQDADDMGHMAAHQDVSLDAVINRVRL